MHRGDGDRGVIVQVAALVVLGFVVISLSLYQAQTVPQQNERVEADHDELVERQLEDAATDFARTSRTGETHPATIDLGTRYAARVVFTNPPPPTGSLRTERFTGATGSNVSVRNVRATDAETADYWNRTHEFRTRALVYAPGYNEYRNAPNRTIEHGLLYGSFESGRSLVTARQSLVQGDRISLFALNGSVRAAGAGTRTLTFRPTSVDESTVRVRPDGGNVTVVVPTRLNGTVWSRLLAPQRVRNGGNVSGVDVTNGRLRVEFVNGTYRLQLAKVGVGSGVVRESAAYVTDVEAPPAVLAAGEAAGFAVEVRDRFDNPVSGVRVTVDRPAVGTVLDRTKTTGADGVASFTYEAGGTGGQRSVDLVARIAPDSREQHRVRYSLRAVTPFSGIAWATAGDWDAGPIANETGVVHESYGDRAGDAVALGYPTGVTAGDRWGPTPTAFFPLDNSTGQVTDATADFDGTVEGSPTREAPGVLNSSAYAFDGTDDYVSVPENLSRELKRTASLSVWIRTTQAGSSNFYSSPGVTGVESPGDGDDIFWGYLTPDGEIGVKGGDSPAAVSTTAVNDGAWHHVVMTRNNATGVVEVYVDGRFEDRATSRSDNITAVFGSLGRIEDEGGTAEYLDGSLDEVRVYDRVLTAREVGALYNFSRRPTPANATHLSSEKSFDSPTQPNLTVRFTLNGGAAAVTVIGSPGTADEERITRRLVGSQSTYDLPWTDDHERFRVRLTANTTDPTDGPVVRVVQLS